MSDTNDVRWKQRFANLVQAHELLEEALRSGISTLNQLEKEGLTQRFEYTFELAWKTLKDYLEESGIPLAIATPREVIKEAFAAKIISNGVLWIRMLDHRNLLSHTYDVKRFEEAIQALDQQYISLLRDIVAFFHTKAREE
ncbi:MAG: nucleotidyltransferase [Ignavibacteriae bacterium]|nr:MAG: nucleotidyltransferase [Ignavibacteriota bacterium]